MKQNHKGLIVPALFAAVLILFFMQCDTYAFGKTKLKDCSVCLESTVYSYSGAKIKPAVIVRSKGTIVKEKNHYTVSYKNNKNVGTAIVYIKGKGTLTGTVKRTFRIKQLQTAQTQIKLPKTTYSYSGKYIKPEVTVMIGKVILKQGTDYTLRYKNNKNVGTATVDVKGKNGLTGTVRKTFYIEQEKGSDTEVLHFRNSSLLEQHYEKHGKEMGFATANEYEKAAASVVTNPDALHKTEAEDGDDVYYVESTNEFVIVSTDGYIRTYFCPNAGIDYYNRQ